MLVLDKVRHDPQAPEACGATITYDVDARRSSAVPLPETVKETAHAPAA